MDQVDFDQPTILTLHWVFSRAKFQNQNCSGIKCFYNFNICSIWGHWNFVKIRINTSICHILLEFFYHLKTNFDTKYLKKNMKSLNNVEKTIYDRELCFKKILEMVFLVHIYKSIFQYFWFEIRLWFTSDFKKSYS